MNILITGADGFIGKNLEKRLNEFDKFKVKVKLCQFTQICVKVLEDHWHERTIYNKYYLIC